MIDFLATRSHFADHLRPIWEALPEGHRGDWLSTKPQRSSNLTVVSAFGDLRAARSANRPTVLTEHGAGQSYVGTDSPSYIGSGDRHGVVAVLVPGEQQAHRHMSAHPKIPAHVIGCPKLDRFHRIPDSGFVNRESVIAVSFHWDCGVVPETRSAWRYYKGAVLQLAKRYKVLGHSHPRFKEPLKWYAQHGIEAVPDFAEVCERATVYVCDNSSTIFEFASLDRPVVVLNCGLYRRSVEHGMRFWEYADIGVQCDRGAQLPDAVAQAIADPPEQAARRREIVGQVYGVTDGTATQRAVAALLEIDGGVRHG